jgi:flagellar hook assembly protein FlgD
MMGRKIKTLASGLQSAGYKIIRWNGSNEKNEQVAAGLYIYTLQVAEFRQTRKMLLLK